MLDLVLAYISLFGVLISFGWAKSLSRQRAYYNDIVFIWYDLWVGAYYSKTKQTFYVVPIPTIVFIFDWKKP